MYVTARMVTVRWAEESSYDHTLYVTKLNASSIAILCLVSPITLIYYLMYPPVIDLGIYLVHLIKEIQVLHSHDSHAPNACSG